MALCNHARRGRVTNQPEGYDKNRPHASVTVCDREPCIREAQRFVAGETNEVAVYVADPRSPRQFRKDAVATMATAVYRYREGRATNDWRYRDATELLHKIARLDNPGTLSARLKRCAEIERRVRWLIDDLEEQSPTGFDAMADALYPIVDMVETYLPTVYADDKVPPNAQDALSDFIDEQAKG